MWLNVNIQGIWEQDVWEFFVLVLLLFVSLKLCPQDFDHLRVNFVPQTPSTGPSLKNF